MGFFASRWIEKHGAANEKAALTTITNGLSGPSISESEGAGTVKSKWVSPVASPEGALCVPDDIQRSNEHTVEGQPSSRWLTSRAEGA